jgi:GntR family transcriptional regulator / MocR family aminotransferase
VTAHRTNPRAAEETAFPPDLLVTLDRSSGRSLREQLEEELRAAIRAGRLPVGTALPASRVLARELGVARGIVVDAYEQLAAEGYLEARQGSGTRVRGTRPTRAVAAEAEQERAAARNSRLLGGLPDPLQFPRAQWLRRYRAALDALPDTSPGYPDPGGAIELRTALAAYLGRVRAVVTSPDELVVCGGFTQGLVLVCRALRGRGTARVAVEDPCFAYHRELIANAGVEPVPIRVDEQGIDVAELDRHDVGAVLVAPAHSYPTGAVLSPQRRRALVEWAHATGGLVIEDDYDAEYRYDRAPIGALQGLARDRVVYGGSVSKTLTPALRVGWLAAPPWLVADLRREKLYDDFATAMLDQLALAAFIADGDLVRHLRRVRPEYRRRRDAALRALALHLPDARPAGVAAGLHLFVELPPDVDERALRHAARREGVRIEGAARHWARREEAPPAFVLGYGGTDERGIEAAVAAVGRAYRSLAATSRASRLGATST